MPTTYFIVKRAAAAALLLSLLAACQDVAPLTAPLDLHPSFTQVASSPVVNSLADPGDGTCDDTECTLREAIAFASSGATITFDPALTGTITLASASGNLSLTKSLTITGPGPDVLAVSGGGAVTILWMTAGVSHISGLTFTNAYHSIGSGGALIVGNPGTELTLTNCAITNSDGGAQGGAIRMTASSLTISSCTLSGNTASSGSAILAYAGTTKILNSTISGNSGGAAVYYQGSSVRIDHSTITGNTVGVQSTISAPAAVVKGSIIWGNSTYDVGGHVDNAFTSLGYNLVGTNDEGWVNFSHDFTATGDQTGVTDAGLGALALNSPGKTRTHALLSESPAIDAGVCTDADGASLTTDQRGVTRPQGSGCDIGAYELQASGSTTPTFGFDLSALPAKTYGDGTFSVSSYATTNSSGGITFATGSGSVGCSVTSGGTVSITGAAVDADACIIEATLAADATYTGAGPISQSFSIAKAAGSVTISNLPSSGTIGGDFTPTYTKAGNGTASTASNSTSVCTVTSGVVNFIAAGTCLLQASVTEGTNHLAATGTEQSFTVSKAAGSVSINNMPSTGTVGGGFTPTFTKSGDGTASVVSLTTSVCTVSGGVVTFDAEGDCILQASVAEGTAHLSATGSQQTVTITAAAGVFSSTCTYTIHPKNGQRLVTIMWENADPGVTLIEVTDGRTVTKQLAPTPTGSWGTNVKTGIPAYGLWGGQARKDVGTVLVPAGTACTAQWGGRLQLRTGSGSPPVPVQILQRP